MKLRDFWLWVAVAVIIPLCCPAMGAIAPPRSLIAGGDNHTLAIRKDGSLWAWGDNESGQLGLGDVLNRAVPTKVWPRSNPGPDSLLLLK